MKFFRSLFIIATASLATASYAGTYYLQSITELGYVSGSLGPLSFTEMKNISGHVITHRTILSGTVGAPWNASSGTLWNVRIRILWVEDYPGEPKPSSVDLVWDASTNGRSGYPLGHPSDTSSASLSFIPTGTFSPSANYSGSIGGSALLGTGGPLAVSGVTHGGVSFAWDSGQWIGTGNISLEINSSLPGTPFSSSFYASDNGMSLELKRTLAGDPIL